MAKIKHPPQIGNLMAMIQERIDQGAYRLTLHALDRQDEREIDLPDVLYVLKNGYHERAKNSFDDAFKTWKYAVRGKTVELIEIRIIVAFDENEMLIITVMHVAKG